MIKFSDQEILDRTSDGVIALDPSYKLLYLNRQALAYVQQDRDHVMGKNIFIIFPILKGSNVEKAFQEVVENKTRKKFEFTIPLKNLTFEVSVYAEEWGVSVYFKDISARKKLERELEASRSQLSLLLEKTSDIIEVVNIKGEIVYMSKSAKSIAGYLPDEVLGKSVFSFVHKEYVAKVREYFKHVIENPGKQVVVQVKVKHKNGNWIWLQAIATNMIQNPAIKGIIVNMRDITEKKKAEERLSYYAALSRSIGDAVISMDLAGNIVTWNKGAEQVYGRKAKEVIGKNVVTMLDGVSETGRPAVEYINKSWRKKIEETGIWTGILQQKTKKGDVIDVQISISYIKNDEEQQMGFIAVCRDITQLKELERNKDRFISMASHELKTPITSAILFTQVLEKRFAKINDVDSQKLLIKMAANLNKLSELVGDLLDVSKLQQNKLVLKKQEFSLINLVKEIAGDLQPISVHKITLRSKLKISINADKEKIRQVITNLITNAIKYDPSEKPIVITIDKKKDEAVISVQDFGIGISKKEIGKIFSQFYQVSDGQKNTYPGLGLGLFISSEIIRLHKGRMWVRSEKGKESIFSFSLPLIAV